VGDLLNKNGQSMRSPPAAVDRFIQQALHVQQGVIEGSWAASPMQAKPRMFDELHAHSMRMIPKFGRWVRDVRGDLTARLAESAVELAPAPTPTVEHAESAHQLATAVNRSPFPTMLIPCKPRGRLHRD
jgi:hypothetical protein